MLTVIGIIVLLVSILLPVVSAVRIKGQTADSQAMLARIAAGIQSYYSDFNAYPGPLGNNQVHATGQSIAKKSSGTVDLSKSTMAENLVLGLLGGLYNDNGVIKYDPDLIGQGPLGLNPRNPKKYHAYMDKVSLPAYDAANKAYKDFKDDVADAEDTEIPEFLDKYPDPLPILYLRAKPGAAGIASNSTDYTQQEQYDLNQVIGYTKTNIGVGKDVSAGEYKNATWPQHGLRTVDKTAMVYESAPPAGMGSKYVYPYDFYAYMRHPTIAGTPKQKDGFLLISAGPDRVYGTKDDLQYPASR
jgi:hypothetical protein